MHMKRIQRDCICQKANMICSSRYGYLLTIIFLIAIITAAAQSSVSTTSHKILALAHLYKNLDMAFLIVNESFDPSFHYIIQLYDTSYHHVRLQGSWCNVVVSVINACPQYPQMLKHVPLARWSMTAWKSFL